MKNPRWIAVSLLFLGTVLFAAENPKLPQAIETPNRFDSRLGFEAVPVVFVIDTKPTLEAAGMHRFDLIEARETPSGRRAVRDSSDFKMFMGDVLAEAVNGVSHLHLRRF